MVFSPVQYQRLFHHHSERLLNKFNMLALDQTNEKRMNKISSLKQECNAQNMALIVCFGIWSSEMLE